MGAYFFCFKSVRILSKSIKTSIFVKQHNKMQRLNLPTYLFNTKSENGRTYILDSIRRKYIVLTPEEWVRQNIIRYLNEEKKYPLSLMSVETGFKLNKLQKRTDIMVFGRDGKAIAIIECKAPDVKITKQVFEQIVRYNLSFKVRFLIVTNGMEHFCCRLDHETNGHEFLKDIPGFEELISK
jgi:type I site-specific restriction endonuclease